MEKLNSSNISGALLLRTFANPTFRKQPGFQSALGQQFLQPLAEGMARVFGDAARKVADGCLGAATNGRDLGLSEAISLKLSDE